MTEIKKRGRGRPPGSKNKAKPSSLGGTVVKEFVFEQPTKLPEDDISGLTFFAPENQVRETKVNPAGTYYQYIHRCGPDLDHFFFIINKGGKQYRSEPFSDIHKCNEVAKDLVEKPEFQGEL